MINLVQVVAHEGDVLEVRADIKIGPNSWSAHHFFNGNENTPHELIKEALMELYTPKEEE